MSGELKDSYSAALQNDIDTPEESDYVFGVVRQPMYGFMNVVDTNLQSLAPPTELLKELKSLTDDMSHNDACKEINFKERYITHINESDSAQDAIDMLIELIESGETVWVVCYENTDNKFCHREVLKEIVQEQLNSE